jgi:hypothetical protein
MKPRTKGGLVYHGPAMDGVAQLSQALRAAGSGMDSHHEGMGRERSPWGSSPAEF